MRLTNRGRGVVAGIIATAIAVTSWAVQHNEQKVDKGDCTVIVAGTVTDKQWDRAVENGWKGIAGDGMEALWSPECHGKLPQTFSNWDADTESDHPSYSEVPLDESGQPVTNPCPWEAHEQGLCDGGW
jgi:hypothetical protein